MSKLRTVVLDALRTALDFALDHLLLGDSVLDAEVWEPHNMPRAEIDALLTNLRSDSGFTAEELDLHLGSPPIAADRRTHTLISSVLRSSFPNCAVVGEEATEAEWDHSESLADGAYTFTIDPIDGSKPYETLTFGYSINILVHRRSAEWDTLTMAAVLNSTGLIALYEDPGRVYVGDVFTPESLRLFTQPMRSDPVSGTVAIVAASPGDRKLMQPVVADRDLTLFNTGGAPASLGIVVGRLESFVAMKQQTRHDAAYLPILAALNVPLLDREMQCLSLPDVLRYFHIARSEPLIRREKPVPPFVACRNLAEGARLARRLLQAPG